jgi:hypothetical protein
VESPNFSAGQYVDSTSLNDAFDVVSGATALYGSGLAVPGLIRPDAMSFSATGLAITANLPAPFGVLFGNGVLAQAHGTQTNQDTSSYSVNFSGLVPASGSVTAYLLATIGSIQQTAQQIIGPQPGHPDYNPSFTPYTAYAKNVDTLAVAATLTAPDNVTSFELFRTTLAAGATGVAINTAYQVVGSPIGALGTLPVSGTVAVGGALAGRNLLATATTTFNLAAMSGLTGLEFTFTSATSGTVTVQANGADLIYGTPSTPSSGLGSFTVEQGVSVTLVITNGVGQIIKASPYGVTADTKTYVTQAVSGLAPLDSPNFSGNVNVGTRATGDATVNAASTAFVQNQIAASVPVSLQGYVQFNYASGILTINASKNLTNFTRSAQGTYSLTPAGAVSGMFIIGGVLSYSAPSDLRATGFNSNGPLIGGQTSTIYIISGGGYVDPTDAYIAWFG